jgi:hypothetical protein
VKYAACLLAVAAIVCASQSDANAGVIFDFAGVNDVTFEHDTDGTNSPAPLPDAGSQNVGLGTFAWGDLRSDSTANTAIFSGGSFAASDWGGRGTFTSNDIDVSQAWSVDIAVQFDGGFNTSSEFSNFFYTLDGGSKVNFAVGLEDVDYDDEAVGLTDLDVRFADTLVVGFDFSHNGAGDYFNVDLLTVTQASTVPEPSSAIVFSGVVAVGMLPIRRRRRPARR